MQNTKYPHFSALNNGRRHDDDAGSQLPVPV